MAIEAMDTNRITPGNRSLMNVSGTQTELLLAIAAMHVSETQTGLPLAIAAIDVSET